jgi:mRNA-degrading endonuclease YafQ of YafQ-DinJ toxin-antitoxin module
MYKSKSLEALHQLDPIDRKRTVQVLRELVNDARISEDDRDMYNRFLAARDPFAPQPPDHPLIAEFKKRNRWLN